MDPARYPYRVFVSYADEDRELANKLVARLRALLLQPVWDQDNLGGWPFVELIKQHIAHSHLFVPLLTPRSVESTWVNHEIGFAIGRSVPVLPLSLGPLPTGMDQALHAEVADHIEDLLLRLTRERINDLVQRVPAVEVYEFADFPEGRTAAIVRHCKELTRLGLRQQQRIRHRAAFGSFSIPSDPDDPIWEHRDAGERQSAREALSEERRLLEAHVLQFGCDLILYPDLAHLSREAVRARIEILRSFLEAMHEASAPVRVKFDESAVGGNLLIVGDWFSAESITPQPAGFRHTTLTSHAPTVLDRIARFERRFRSQGLWMSADKALMRLDQRAFS